MMGVSEGLLRISVGLEGTLGHRQLRIRTAHPFPDAHTVRRGATDAVILAGGAVPGLVALAIGADGAATIEVPNAREFVVRRDIRVPPAGLTVNVCEVPSRMSCGRQVLL